MAARREHGLAAVRGRGQSIPERLAGVQHVIRIDPYVAGDRAKIDRFAGFPLDEAEHVVFRETLGGGEPEELVGIAVQQQRDVPSDVVERVGRDPRGAPLEQGVPQRAAIEPTGHPAIVELGQTARVRFDNVHGIDSRERPCS